MIKYAFYEFEFGYLKIGYANVVVTYLKRADDIDDSDNHSTVSDSAFSQIREYLDGERKTFDFLYELHGTEFQKKVWNALCDIPYGETRTYKEIAISLDNPKASRAVGLANHHNPIWIVVPCHRVIGTNKKLIGYAGGIHMKEELLDLEKKYRRVSDEAKNQISYATCFSEIRQKTLD